MLRSPLVTVEDKAPRNGSLLGIRNGFVHHTAVIGENANIGDNVKVGAFVVIDCDVEIEDGVEIGPHVSIGPLVRIGTGTVIHPHVTIRERVRVGRNVTINSGSVIGSDGFGFANESGVNHKIPQLGIVEIEDEVWIGSNVTIDRATVGATRLRRGARIENLVQIGHNVDVGEGTIVRPKVGIAGSTTIGSESYVGEQAGIVGHIEIGKHVTIYPFSGITRRLSDGQSVMGVPARPMETEKSLQAIIKDLPDIVRGFQLIRRRMSAVL